MEELFLASPLGRGGMRQGFPEANEMSFGGSLRLRDGEGFCECKMRYGIADVKNPNKFKFKKVKSHFCAYIIKY